VPGNEAVSREVERGVAKAISLSMHGALVPWKKVERMLLLT
jgi:hypothetical protein